MLEDLIKQLIEAVKDNTCVLQEVYLEVHGVGEAPTSAAGEAPEKKTRKRRPKAEIAAEESGMGITTPAAKSAISGVEVHPAVFMPEAKVEMQQSIFGSDNAFAPNTGGQVVVDPFATTTVPPVVVLTPAEQQTVAFVNNPTGSAPVVAIDPFGLAPAPVVAAAPERVITIEELTERMKKIYATDPNAISFVLARYGAANFQLIAPGCFKELLAVFDLYEGTGSRVNSMDACIEMVRAR